MIPFPNKKYKVIYADPPWEYSSDPNSKRGIWGLAHQQYQTMELDELKTLPPFSKVTLMPRLLTKMMILI